MYLDEQDESNDLLQFKEASDSLQQIECTETDNQPALRSVLMEKETSLKDPLLSQALFGSFAFQEVLGENSIQELNGYEVLVTSLEDLTPVPKTLCSKSQLHIPNNVLKTMNENTGIDSNTNAVNCTEKIEHSESDSRYLSSDLDEESSNGSPMASFPSTVLKTVLDNSSMDLTGVPTNVRKRVFKSDILQKRVPVSLEVVPIRSGMELFIRDAADQIFVTQHVELSSPIIMNLPVRHQEVSSVILHPICNETEAQIPQITTTIGSKIQLCPVQDCTEAFLQPALAKAHALNHLGIKPFHCTFPGCRWKFTRESHLTRHMTSHDNVKNFVCDIPKCGKDFSTIYNLNEHKKKRHLLPATKICPVNTCAKVFRNDKELRSHCKVHNKSEAPFQCPYESCEKAFFFQTRLEIHTKCHQYENMHTCSYQNCGKTFLSNYRLKEHIRTHTGCRPYICTVDSCTQSFSTASKSKRHEKTHMKLKIFNCTVEGCDRPFKRSNHLSDHLKKVHCQDKSANSSQDCTPFAALMPDAAQSSTHITINYAVDDFDLTSAERTNDDLLEAAIKSIRVPEIILEGQDLLNEPLNHSDISTVNFQDLQ